MTPRRKRQFDRIPAELDVEFMVDGRVVHARSKDISLGGMFIETDSPPPYGTQLRVHVTLPDLARPVVIEAIVRWTAPSGMGVQFGGLRIAETWAIHRLPKR